MPNKVKTLFSNCIQPIQTPLENFETEFDNTFKQDIGMIRPVLHDAGSTEGKRIRPILFFLTQGLIGIKEIGHSLVAVLLEMLHSVSLMHDDVVDESNLRRGAATMNAVWGNKLAVLAGDYLLAKMLSIGLENKQYRALNRISDAAVEMGRGELMQGVIAFEETFSIDDYFLIIEKKTAMLFGVACELAAYVTDGCPVSSETLFRLGLNFGMSFQIMDDILDLTGNDGEMGKPTGQDLMSGKLNIPLVLALHHSSDCEKQKILARMREHTPLALNEIETLIDIDYGLEQAHITAEKFAGKATRLLKQFDQSIYQKSILDLLQFNLERKK